LGELSSLVVRDPGARHATYNSFGPNVAVCGWSPDIEQIRYFTYRAGDTVGIDIFKHLHFTFMGAGVVLPTEIAFGTPVELAHMITIHGFDFDKVMPWIVRAWRWAKSGDKTVELDRHSALKDVVPVSVFARDLSCRHHFSE